MTIDSVFAVDHAREKIFSFLKISDQLTLVSKKFLRAAVAAVQPWSTEILRSEFFSSFVESVDLSFTKNRVIGNFSLPNVKRLTLAACHWVDDDVLLEISSTKISDLNLYWCVNVTDVGVCGLIGKNAEMKSLVLSGCNKLTDVTMHEISEKFPTLQVLDVTRCPLVTDAGLSEISESPKISASLLELNLYAKVQNIDPSFYPKIGNFSNLRSLDLCGHLKLTDAVMASLVRKLPALRKLNLSWCVEIGDETVLALADSRISWLSLFGIKKISAFAIETLLAKRGSVIEGLDIRGIPNVHYLTVGNCEELRRRANSLRLWKIHT